MKIKTTTCLLISLICSFANADTPLAQALKVQQCITDVKNAIQSRGVECLTLESMSNAVMRINDINQFASGTYSGMIQLQAKTVDWLAFTRVPGSYILYAPNLRSACASAYRYAYGLTEVNAPTLTSLSEYMFADCINLKTAHMPNCRSIAQYAFQNDNIIENIDISNTSSIEGKCAFENCYNLKNITAKPLAYCADYCFANCHNLTNIVLSEHFSCGECAFQNCYNLKVKLPKNFDGYSYAMFENCQNIDEIDLSDEDTTRLTKDKIFNGCTGVTNLNLGPVLELCGDQMFSNLGIIVLSNEVLECIGKTDDKSISTFANNGRLKKIYLSKLKSIEYGVATENQPGTFGGCTKLEEVYMPELYIIGKEYETSSDYYDQYYSSRVFIDCISLKSIDLPKLRELHGCMTFYNCSSLTNISMPSLKIWCNGAEGIAARGLMHCKSLKKIHLPNLEQISFSYQMFYNCYNLEEVIFPKLTTIYYRHKRDVSMEGMFEYCASLKHVTFGYKAAQLLNVNKFPGSAPLTTVFHCTGDAPNIVDIVYKNGSWQQITNGTYKLVDYIKGTGTQYLNTGVIYNTNTVIELDCWLGTGSNQSEELFGSSASYMTKQDFHACCRLNNEQKFSFVRTDSESVGTTYEEGNYHIVASNDVMKVFNDNMELIQQLTVNGKADEGASPLGIFTCNKNGYNNGFTPSHIATNMKLYRAKIYKDGELKCDFVPALANNDIPCVVDIVNNYHPHFNYGTGDFEYGSVTNDTIIINQ